MNAIKSLKWLIALALLATAGIGNVWADGHGGHGHFGVVVGVPLGPWYYPGPYAPHYYPPYYPTYYPPVVIERAPPVYVEQSAPQQTSQSAYWYYCAAAKTYYPYVKECPAGWERVAPQPPGQP